MQTPRNFKRAVVAAGLTAAFMAIPAILIRHALDPSYPMLLDAGGARWIIPDDPIELQTWYRDEPRVAVFRRSFEAGPGMGPVSIQLRSMGAFQVAVDGAPQNAVVQEAADWRRIYTIELGEFDPGREHFIEIIVGNSDGPPGLWVSSAVAELNSDVSWKSIKPGETPQRVFETRRARSAALSAHFAPVWRYVPAALLVLAPIAFLAVWMRRRIELAGADPPWRTIRRCLAPERMRWFLMGSLLLLGLNNMFKLDLQNGFDAKQHVEYIQFIYDNGRLPLAGDGWQMFQTPLFYIVEWLVGLVTIPLFEMPTPMYLFRIVPILCGVAQVEIAFRLSRYVVPGNPRAQVLATAIGGLTGMNIYMSQSVGNEPMAAAWAGASIVVIARILSRGEAPALRWVAFWGVLCGLAILSKVSALLLLPPGGLAIASCYAGRSQFVRNVFVAAAVAFAAVFLVTGWYFVRNWVELGSPWVNGWEASRGYDWYQDPAYRTLGEYLRFGRALSHPILASTAGFWDGLYSTFWLDGYLSARGKIGFIPPWNLNLLMTQAWLSIAPLSLAVAAGAAGLVQIWRNHANPWTTEECLHLYLLSAIAIYVLAIFAVHAGLPIYSTSKASYMLAVLSCVACLAAKGTEFAGRNPRIRLLTDVVLTCWGVGSFAAYFVV